MWFYAEIEIGGQNKTLSPNNITFWVRYANGTSCTQAFNSQPDVIQRGKVVDIRIGNNLDGIIGGMESWRQWLDWPFSTSRTCDPACMGNGMWCLEENDSTSCFPEGIYIIEDSSKQEGSKFSLLLSRPFHTGFTLNVCDDILENTPGTGAACTYDEGSLTLTVFAGVGGDLVGGTSTICIHPTKALPAGVLTANALNCFTLRTHIPQQIGNKFLFYFQSPLPLIDCTIVIQGLELLGTDPVCTASGSTLSILGNLTDSTFTSTDSLIIYIPGSGTAVFNISEGIPSVSISNSPDNNGEWDVGAGGNEWRGKLEGGGTLVPDTWSWSTQTGTTITFSPNQSTQAFAPEQLPLAVPLSLVSLQLNFSNANWILLTAHSTPLKFCFSLLSNLQTQSLFTIILSHSLLSISTCSHIFHPTTVTALGGPAAACIYTGENKTLRVYAAGNHSLTSASTLIYENMYLLSNTSNFPLTSNLPSATLGISEGSWTLLQCSSGYTLTITPLDLGTIQLTQLTYQFLYLSGPFNSYTFTHILNELTIHPYSLPPATYQIKYIMQIPDYNNYSYSGTQTFTIKATKTHLLQHGPKFIITLDSNWWPELISSCGDVFESIDSIKAGSSCVVNTLDTKELFVYVANTSTIQIGDTFQLKSAAFNNNTFAATAAVPLFLEMSLSDATKHWHKDQGQNITAVTQHLAGLDTYFTIEYIYTLSGIQNFTFTGDSPFRTIKEYSVSAGNYTLIGIVSMNDSAGKVSLYQSMEDVTVALIPYPKARGLNASYPKMMQINLTSELCIDMDTGQRSEDLKYTWELYSDKSLSTLYLAWKSNLDHPIFLSNYFPVGVYYMKLIVTKWEYYSSWTWGVLNITTSDIMIELQSPNSLRSDQTTTFQSLVVSMEGDADFELVWLLTPPVYNRYQKANYLTIPAGTFCPGGIYLLRCSLKSSQRLRYLNSDYEIPNIEITLNIPPSINVGSLIVNPMEGDGLDTQFSLTANHWLDPDLNPLTYKFSYTIIGLTSPTILSSWDHSNAITGVKLPHGKDVFHNIVEIKVEGRNSKNSTATIRKNITVNPIVIADKGAFADNLLSSATTAAEKLAAIASLTFLVEEDTDYAQPDACGGCHSQHGKCDSLVQSCICHDGYTASPLCNIPDTQLSQILNVSDLLATSIYIYIYILFIDLILNAEEALKTAEGAAGIFGTASNVLSNQIPLPTVAEKIENLIYSFLDKLELDESELESESKLELTEELVEGLMNTLGKIGGAMVVEERSESVIKDSERMKNRSEKYLSNLDKLTSTLISSLPPGTELNKDVGSFMVKGGKYAVEDISGKELESESSGSKVNMPEWNLGNDSSSIIQYKYLVFNNNPRTNIFNQTIGTTQGFNLYSSKSKDKIIAQNLSHPIIFQFTMIGLTNETLSKLKCSFFNSTLANYSTNGMTTLSKTIRPDGTILIKCQSTHLSEFAVATNPADDFTTDAKSIVDNNNLDAVAEFDNIDQVNVAESIRMYPYIPIYTLL